MTSRSLQEWLTSVEARHPNEIDLGLERISEVWSRIQTKIPEQPRKPKIITVAGTNGKGSCVAAMQAILLEHNYTVGSFTSPHFVRYNERININGEVASDRLIVDAFELIEDMRESISLTYFEINALAALLIFRQSKLDCVLLEVGLGGRLDAVNIVDADVAVLSSIDLDHQEWLGDSRLKIGIEKIGISRPGKPFIISEENLPDGLLEAIKNTQADYLRLGKNFKYEMNSSGDQFSAYLVTQGLVDSIKLLQTNDLLPKNTVTAIQALLSAEFDLSHNLIRKAVSNLSLTGRQQKLIYRGIPVLLDVAHNPAAARVLAGNISQFSGAIYAVASVLSDKDWMGIVSELNDFIDEWFIAEISDNPRAANGQQLLEMVYTSDKKGVCYASIEEAFLQAIAGATLDDKVVVFGSFHTVSTVLAFIEREG